MKRIRRILKGLSLTGALFVFQACYGTPQPYPAVQEEPVETATEEQVPDGETPAAGEKTEVPTQG